MPKLKKRKVDKKKSKRKKKHKKRHSSTSSTSQSDNESASWVEKSVTDVPSRHSHNTPSEPDPSSFKPEDNNLTDNTWMESLIPTYTRQDLKKPKDEQSPKPNICNDQLGQHPRELNPYWKDGGVGLPKTAQHDNVQGTAANLDWLERAYKRCKEESQETGVSMEIIAAERWGSLEKLKSLIDDGRRERRRGGLSQQLRESPERADTYQSSRMGGVSSPHSDYRRQSCEDGDLYQTNSTSQRGKDFRSFHKPDEDKEVYSASKYPRSFSPSRSNRDRGSGGLRGDNDPADKTSRSFQKPYEDDSFYGSMNYPKSHSVMRSKQDRGSGMLHQRGASSSRSFRKPDEDDGLYHTDKGPESYSSPSTTQHRVRGQSPNNNRTGALSKNSEVTPLEYDNYSEHCLDRLRSKEDDPKSREGGANTKLLDSKHSTQNVYQSSSSVFHDDSGMSPNSESSPLEPCVDSVDDLNKLSARILRAEMLGDSDTVKRLKVQLENAQNSFKSKDSQIRPPSSTKPVEMEVILLTKTTRRGMEVPVEQERRTDIRTDTRKRKVVTHDKDGQRTRYFRDDDASDLRVLFEKEKRGTSEDETSMFLRLSSKVKTSLGKEEIVDDLMLDKAATLGKEQSQIDKANRLQAVYDKRKLEDTMQTCKRCFEKTEKHLVVSVGKKVYLHLPPYKSLTPGHCHITPMSHISCSVACDEEIFAEIQNFRKALTRMFLNQDEDCVFMETYRSIKHHPHMSIECIPVSKEHGDLMPIYFKKALMECESEWAQNKKLIDLSKKSIQHSVPHGFPYFAVDFGLQGGYAHAIEDERTFPEYFGREIVGGVLDVEPSLWRKPRKDSFSEQSHKVLQFVELWKSYDFTNQS